MLSYSCYCYVSLVGTQALYWRPCRFYLRCSMWRSFGTFLPGRPYTLKPTPNQLSCLPWRKGKSDVVQGDAHSQWHSYSALHSWTEAEIPPTAKDAIAISLPDSITELEVHAPKAEHPRCVQLASVLWLCCLLYIEGDGEVAVGYTQGNTFQDLLHSSVDRIQVLTPSITLTRWYHAVFSFRTTSLISPVRGRGYSNHHVCLSVCLSVCYRSSGRHIQTKRHTKTELAIDVTLPCRDRACIYYIWEAWHVRFCGYGPGYAGTGTGT